MGRPVKPRAVSFLPPVKYFRPGSGPGPAEEAVNLFLDEWEALRLKDYLGLDQEECARLMAIAQSSFQRVLASARSKLVSAVVEGKPVAIEGGTYRIVGRGLCRQCRHEWEFPPDPEAQEHRRCPSCGNANIGRRGLGRGRGAPGRRGSW